LPQDELRLDLSRAIQSLPENHREVVLLRDIEEMTVDEIAATLNLTRESVKGRLRRARALLREYLLN
jgi:RNA polymerase sigma-70 factor (ECF subfamily)